MIRKALLVALLSLLWVGSADAIIDFGDPIESGSWGQRFYGDVGNDRYEFFRVDWISGSFFSTSGLHGRESVMHNFTHDWSAGWSHATSASAYGPTPTDGNDVYFDIYFEDPKSNPTSFYFHAYDASDNIVDEATASWSGSSWSFISSADWHPPQPRMDPIPEPTTLLLLGLGMVSMFAVRRIRRSK